MIRRSEGNARSSASRRSAVADDRFFLIHDVSYEQYRTVRKALDQIGGLKMTYLDGTLELMSPGERHELVKTLVARLVELYAVERDVDLTGYGSTTFRRKARRRGLEPDECYCVGPARPEHRKRPDIAFEVLITRGSIDKLDVYRGLRVPEVWFWEQGRFSLFHLGPKGYRSMGRSLALPDLDFGVLEKLVASEKRQPDVVREFRDILRKG